MAIFLYVLPAFKNASFENILGDSAQNSTDLGHGSSVTFSNSPGQTTCQEIRLFYYALFLINPFYHLANQN